MSPPYATSAPGAAATIALMYHALSGPGSPLEGQDEHYSVSTARFAAQLALLARRGGGVSARDWLSGTARGAALLTFDDGHLSNYSLALPALLESRAGADFFVNPGRVGKPGFADWAQLREMSERGMSIQSHGWNHRYFTDLTTSELREDLWRSRRMIEDRLGCKVTLLAPPGGRMPERLAELAHDCGYSHVLSSQPGRIRDAAARVLPRMAVTANLHESTLDGWLDGRGLGRARLRYATLGLAKRALGDRGYERLRARLLGQARGDA